MITVFNTRLSLSLPGATPHLNVMKTSQSFSFDQTRGHFHSRVLLTSTHPSKCRGVALCVWESHFTLRSVQRSSGLVFERPGACFVFRPWSQPHKALPSVSAMNPPLQARFSDALHSSDNGDIDFQPSQVVGHPGPAEARDGQSIQYSERRASDLQPNYPILI